MFRQSMPELGLSVEQGTDAVPDDGCYYVLLHSETVLVAPNKKLALKRYTELRDALVADDATPTLSREAIRAKLLSEREANTMSAERSRAKREHATYSRGRPGAKWAQQ